MDDVFFVGLRGIVLLLGAALLVVFAKACFKGAVYIGAANYLSNNAQVKNRFAGRWISYQVFRATPFAALVLGGWAGYSLFFDLLFPLGDLSFFHREFGELVTYRYSLSSSVGSILGLFFSWWLVRLCEDYAKMKLTENEAEFDSFLDSVFGKPRT